MATVGDLLYLVLSIFIVLLFVRLIVDWIQFFARAWVPHGPVLVMLEGVYSATDPPVKALRRVIPPLRLGGMAIDLSFVALLIICYILQRLIVGRLPLSRTRRAVVSSLRDPSRERVRSGYGSPARTTPRPGVRTFDDRGQVRSCR